MTDKNDKINKAVWKAINKTINKFREHPYYFFTESDIHSYFYYALYSSEHEALTKDGKRMYCIHREYPTNFRYKKKELLNDRILEPPDLETKSVDRGHYDMAVLDPDFIKNANSKKDIINKDVRLVIKRAKNNKNFEKIKELLFAIEFKYVINNSKKFVYEVKMDNKKLLFAKSHGGAAEAVNLVFCNVDFKYKDCLVNAIKDTSDDILSVLIQSYYKEKKININPIMNKEESRIKHGESLKISKK